MRFPAPATASPDAMRGPALSPAEFYVLRGIARGVSNREMAAERNRSIKTIEALRHTLYAKLGARKSTDAIVLALRVGALKLENIQLKD